MLCDVKTICLCVKTIFLLLAYANTFENAFSFTIFIVGETSFVSFIILAALCWVPYYFHSYIEYIKPDLYLHFIYDIYIYIIYKKYQRKSNSNLIQIDLHIKKFWCYFSVNKVPKGLKIKVTPQTPGIKTNNFYRRWDIILFECSTRLLKPILDDASFQEKDLEKIFSNLLKTSEEQTSTEDFTSLCRR